MVKKLEDDVASLEPHYRCRALGYDVGYGYAALGAFRHLRLVDGLRLERYHRKAWIEVLVVAGDRFVAQIDLDLEAHFLTRPDQVDDSRGSSGDVADLADKLVLGLYVRPVDACYEVARQDAAVVGGAVLEDMSDKGALLVLYAELFGRCLVAVDAEKAHAEPAVADGLVLDEIVDRAFEVVDGDGETQAHGAAGLRGYPCIDAHDLALDVDEGSAGVTLVDGRVSLDEIVDIAVRTAISAHGAHDARRHRRHKAERAAEGDGPVSYLYFRGIAQLGYHDIGIACFEFHEGDILALVGSHKCAGEFSAVAHYDGDLLSVARHMVVREDVDGLAGFPDDDARSEAFLAKFRRLLVGDGFLRTEEKFEGDARLGFRGIRYFVHDIEFHHRGQNGVSDIAEGGLDSLGLGEGRADFGRHLHARRFRLDNRQRDQLR